jgi:hypothetical protein
MLTNAADLDDLSHSTYLKISGWKICAKQDNNNSCNSTGAQRQVYSNYNEHSADTTSDNIDEPIKNGKIGS